MDKTIFYAKLAQMLDVPPGAIHGPCELKELDAWDSLAVVSFVAMADSDYHVALPDGAIGACRTVDDLARLVEDNEKR
jgi:acyl carrier protein